MIFYIILTAFAWIFYLIGLYIIISCLIGVLRFKEFFVRVHAIKTATTYGISLILFSQGLICGSLSNFIQLFVIIILNILMTLMVVHAICRVALNNNIKHDGVSRRKYNEMLEEQKKKEQEEKFKR